MNKKQKQTSLERIVDGIVFISLLVFYFIIWRYNRKNNVDIPVHFNIQGTADAFASPEHLYGLAALNTVLIAGLYLLKCKNISLNFGQEVTPTNKDAVMQVMRQTLSLFALSIVVIFGIILYETITYDSNNTAYSFILIFVSIKVPIVFYFLKTQNIKQ
ncbi:hypothetical protein H1R17_03610 [Flavobacterium sp. xlx-214]|uniref:hypothetical protein n=1 Tax=unclassified Flavobacterium TaxID=196869 RepID=UPI0013D0510F|nr:MULTISPECIES: hypothetical protein [unclassified Flavobacterium]MBA5791977.1 hypothetical protein [Flavobacterium sp. xlx-221]QMI84231.1 hypothetical protein H1R17_03610 [Flavobacterium sp. xlx-214]